MILELREVKKHFSLERGRTLHAVDGVSLALREKEVVGLVGESGCGKSTLGKTVVGLLEKTSGDVYFRGERLPRVYGATEFRKYARKVHMIFQDPYSSLDPRMTVREIVAEGPRIHGLWRRSEVQEKVAFWLERVGLARDHMSRYAHEFSGGQRQRLGIARALALEPEVVVCDEPISALDVSVQAQVVNLLQDLQQKFGLTYLFVAHDLAVVEHISNRVAVMYLGRIVEIGPVREVFRNPVHPYTEALLSAVPVPDPLTKRDRIFLEGDVPSPVDPPSGCRFHTRCPQRTESCSRNEQVLTEVSPGHWAACQVRAAGTRAHEVAAGTSSLPMAPARHLPFA